MVIVRDHSLRCRRWQCPGVYDYIYVDDMFQCPICGMEEWGVEGEGNGTVSNAEARLVYRLQLRYTDTLRKHGGGSRSAGRKRKDRHKFNPNVEGVQPNFRQYDEV